MPAIKKTQALYRLMEMFLTCQEISSYDKDILEEFGCDQKTLERYLKEIESLYDHIVTVKKVKQKVWRRVRVSDIFEAFVKNSDDISQLFMIAREFDPEIFKEFEESTFAKLAKNDENIFLFINPIFEVFEDSQHKQNFNNLKQAIKLHEYRKLKLIEREPQIIKPIKLIFMDSNWYIAFVDEYDRVKFSRLSFIEYVEYADKNSYQPHTVQKHLKFLKKVQNSMTLYDVNFQTAILTASPKISKYFQKEMKKFFPTQQFLETLNDGSVRFSIDYTQELEILPFIQRWMPDIMIESPSKLRDAYQKKLNKAINLFEKSI